MPLKTDFHFPSDTNLSSISGFSGSCSESSRKLKIIGAAVFATRINSSKQTRARCDKTSNTAYRREIHCTLALGEYHHILQRALYRGGITAVRGRRDEELIATSGVLKLLASIVLAWNTSQAPARCSGTTWVIYYVQS